MTDEERADLLFTIRYALQYGLNGQPLSKTGRWPDPAMTADRVLEHIERSGWLLGRKPPAPPHSAG